MLARKATAPSGSNTTKIRARKKAATNRSHAEAVAAGPEHGQGELDALLTVILDDIDTKLAALNADLDRISAA